MASSFVVPYRIGGTAINVTDYSLSPASQTLTNGTITIPANAVSATLTLTPIQGDLAETLETCILTIAGNPFYTISQTQNSALVNIQDGSSPAYSWVVLKAVAADQNATGIALPSGRTAVKRISWCC